MHGFHSPHPRMFKHPHKGGIVNKELRKRGFIEDIQKEKTWTRSIGQKYTQTSLILKNLEKYGQIK